MTVRSWMVLVALMTLTTGPALCGEREPNDAQADATPLAPGETVPGLWHDGDTYDYYVVTVPAAGVLAVELGGQPPEVQLQLMALGFSEDERACLGFEDTAAGAPLAVDITAKPGRGFLAVRVANVTSTRSEGGRSFFGCGGAPTLHLAPSKAGGPPPGALPATVEGTAVAGPIEYSLSTRFSPAQAGAAPSPGWTRRAIAALSASPSPTATSSAVTAAPPPALASLPPLPPAPPPVRLGAAAPADADVAGRFVRAVLAGDYATALALASPAFAEGAGEAFLRSFHDLVADRGQVELSASRSAALDDQTDVISSLSYADGSSLTVHVLLRDGRVTGFHAQPGAR